MRWDMEAVEMVSSRHIHTHIHIYVHTDVTLSPPLLIPDCDEEGALVERIFCVQNNSGCKFHHKFLTKKIKINLNETQ